MSKTIIACHGFSNFLFKVLVYNYLLLNRLRIKFSPALDKIGLLFASTGLSANFWSFVGLAISLFAGLSYSLANPFFNFDQYSLVVTGSLLVLLSGFFDIVDGSVARATNKTSKKGAFLDSSFDKISEIWIFISLAIGNLAEPIICILALGLSLMVSYTRARAESLGVHLQGIGIGERAERLLIIAIIGAIPVPNAMQWALIIVSVLAAITIIQRIVTTAKKL